MTYPRDMGHSARRGRAGPRSPPRSSMKLASALFLASAVTVLSLGDATANDADRRSLYAAANVVDFLSREIKNELKITPEQERVLKATEEKRQKFWRKYAEDAGKNGQSKLPEKEKNAKARALETQVCEDLFDVYGEALRDEQLNRMKQIILQIKGMEIFDHP